MTTKQEYVDGTSAIVTFTGRWFDVLNPDPEQVCIEDIAHSLACTNRYGGHIAVPYSVAQHSVMCAYVAPPEWKLECLLHDAAEAYLGDMPKPIKRKMPDYRRLEAKVEQAIRARFGLPGAAHPQAVGDIDLRMLVTEARHFGMPWWSWHDAEPYYELVIRPTDWATAKLRFLQAFEALTK